MLALLRFLALCIVISGLAPSLSAAATSADDPHAWMDEVTLVVLETTDVESLHAARAFIQHEGGTVGVISPPSMLLGWIPRSIWPKLEGYMGIASLHREPVTAASVGLPAAKLDDQSRTILNFYNAVASGELRQTLEQPHKSAAPNPKPGDVLTAPAVEPDAFLENLLAQGYSEDQLSESGVLDLTKDNTFVMSGTVAVSIFFAESDGSGSDPNLYDWDYSHYQSYANLAISGLMWWSFEADLLSGCWVAFLPTMVPPTDPRCNTSVEIILHGSSTVTTLVSEIMANCGFNSGNDLSRANAYATDQRLTLGTDRSYVAFIGYNPPGTSSRLSGGMAAWAYYYGPYTFLLWNTYGELANRVFAHESGHIFGACDEYADGCSCPGGCANDVDNYNCEDCGDQQLCIMTGDDNLTLCAWTDAHVGWRVEGACQEPVLPAPTLTGISPGSGLAGETLDLTVTGTNLFGLPRLDLGNDVTLNEVTHIDDTEIVANVTIGHIATPGLRDAVLQTATLRMASLADAFEIIPTPVHYVSPTGGNVFPYVNPQDAATSLLDALAVAGAGDTVRLTSTTYTNLNLTVVRDVELEGAWDPTFTTRDLGAKTEITLVQNIRARNCDLTLDGLILRNGTGRSEFLPVEGRYGGAAAVINGALTIQDCEIFDNTCIAANLDTAHGGAVYGHNGTVNVFDTVFTGNLAYQGGAIYLENCSGTIAGNTFVGNEVSAALGVPTGAGIHIHAGTSVVLQDNVFDANVGAQNGGAVYVKDSTGTQILGGAVQSHTTTGDGAGVYVTGSEVLVDGVRFENNSTPGLGGGLIVDATSPLTLRSCQFLSNQALLAGGLQATSTPSVIDHSLFAGNSATFSGSAAYVSNAASGSFSGNTVDGNQAASGATLLFVNSPVTVLHNLVTNNTGIGVFCSGPGMATLSYNDVWNNSAADYDGCTPGTGAFSADPLFVDAGGGDYHLGLHSPAIDTGHPDAAYVDPDGSRADLGWYGSHAFVMDQPAYPQNLSVAAVNGDVVLQWDANGEADLASYVVYADDVSGFAPGPASFVTLVAAGNTSANLGPSSGATFYRLAALDDDGYMSGYSNEAELDTGTPTDPTPTHRWVLHQNVPNPFNPQTTIRYELRERGPVQLTVYDVTGRVVRRLVSGVQDAGLQSVIWNATSDDGARVASGMYFYKLRAGSFVATNKMVVLK
jgi:predicted outer membrane repeat protein